MRHFISRHAGAIAWARQHYSNLKVMSQLDLNAIGLGDEVLGTLPIHLVAAVTKKGAVYRHLVLDLTPDLRGTELTAEDMERVGAHFESYSAQRMTD